jgi:hypothetical protein
VEGFILYATTGASDRRTLFAVIEYRDGRHRIVTSQPKEELDLFQKLKFSYPRPRV